MNQNNSTTNNVKLILGSQYFIYFGVLGIFLPFFNLYCYHLDFTGKEIGYLSALRTGATVLFPLLWGALADRFQARRIIYICCNFFSTAIWALFLYTTDFWTMFFITLFYGIFYSPIISFLEAFSMDFLGKEKKSYGKIRAWGTIHFILISTILGKVLDIYSIKLVIILILAGSIIQSVISLKIPCVTVKEKQDSLSSASKTLLTNKIIIFLICAFLMLLSHGAYYGFFSIHLENLGYTNIFIGSAWALASAAEIIVMINSDRLFKHITIEKILVVSFIIAAVRWLILYFAVSSTVILFTQLFHAASYGMFHMASILYIDRLFPDRAKTFGQAVNNAVTYGLGLTAGFIISGWIYEAYGSAYIFIFSCVAALLGGIILWFYYKKSATTT